MAIELRWYQQKVQRESGEAFRLGFDKQIWVMPAGSGKTFTSGDTIRKIVKSGRRAYFFCHKDDLVKQSYNSFKQLGMRCGIISSKYPKEVDYEAPVQIISIPTWIYRGAKLREVLANPDFGFFDECHHLGSQSWVNVYDYLIEVGAKVIGLTATPCRLDGKPLGKYFDKIILGPSVAELIEEGSLSGFDYYIPKVLDMSGAKKVGGDYSKKDVKERFEKSKIMGDIPKRWLELCKGTKTIGFAPNIEQGKMIAEECEQHGIRCGFLDGTDNKATREDIIGKFADGKIDILWNINLFSEGFDLSAQVGRDVPIESVLLCRPTASLSLYIQQVTRALRKKPTKACIIDFVGNAMKGHGLPDDDREWSLEQKIKSKRESDNEEKGISIAHCTECYRAYEGHLNVCPYCGETREKTKREYEIEKQHELIKIKEIEKSKKEERKKNHSVMVKKLYSCGNRDEMVHLLVNFYYDGVMNNSNAFKAKKLLTTKYKNALMSLYGGK